VVVVQLLLLLPMAPSPLLVPLQAVM